MARIALGCMLLLAIVAWAANPRACCPKTDCLGMAFMPCPASACDVQSSPQMGQTHTGLPCLPVKAVLRTSEPMPRGALNNSEPMPFLYGSALSCSQCLISATIVPLAGEEPESVFTAPPRQPPRSKI